MTWGGLSPIGYRIWTDGHNIYYSYYNIQYKLNGTTWGPMTWSGTIVPKDGSEIWTDGKNIYSLGYPDNNILYKLNGTTWEPITLHGELIGFGSNEPRDIWTDGTDIYYLGYILKTIQVSRGVCT